ncbi:hypothetical protein V9T40_002714 [Parthenolecanium corni]|uniref:Phosphatidic acid phosphatase type 2/haloperoxidase domain-containing protein n=1 Tax=Parthenolecanium corni TaxID=536013 RepID=A0AAN9TIZ8_9HEMI
MDGQVIDVLKPVLVDVFSFTIISSFNLYVAHLMIPTRRGFFCGDESIRYPFHGSTVPAIVLNIVGIIIPLACILFFELKDTQENKKRGPTYKLAGRKLQTTYWNVFKMVSCYASGAIFCQLMTDIGKKTIGRLRPNFIDVCKPNLSELCLMNNYSYITDYSCSVPDDEVNKSRVSFPSGHSSFSFYVAVFLVLYLQKRLKVRTLLLKPIIQFLLILLAWWVALSRVMNNKHHWSDVLVGILLGTTTAIVNTVLIHRIFSSKRPVSSSNVLAIQSVNAPSTTVNSHEAHDQL